MTRTQMETELAAAQTLEQLDRLTVQWIGYSYCDEDPGEWTADTLRDFLVGYITECVEIGIVEAVHCACGDVYGERCEWSGSAADTVVVEVMPAQYRASHEAAGYSGSYPSNGAIRIRVAQDCADRLIETEDGWASIRSRSTR